MNSNDFRGDSSIVQSLLAQAQTAAEWTDHPILVTGEIGAGKSQLARLLHARSPRAEHPLVFVDCGSFQDLDNILYGHRSGSFTGAVRDLGGRLHQADGGTLVLDDLDRLSLHQQDQLHRVLVDGSYYPVGCDRRVKVDTRFIATTNKDVNKEVDAGHLKADFISRLNYFHLHVPPLRERLSDIPSLCESLLRRNLEELVRKGIRKDNAVHFDEDCWPAIQARHFEDNVRGLDKLVVRLLARIQDRYIITPADIAAVWPVAESKEGYWFEQPTTLRRVREAAERRYIIEVCNLTKFNLRRAARVLDISPKSLYAKLKQYGIARP